jgi:hypothetical protein
MANRYLINSDPVTILKMHVIPDFGFQTTKQSIVCVMPDQTNVTWTAVTRKTQQEWKQVGNIETPFWTLSSPRCLEFGAAPTGTRIFQHFA